MSESAAGIERHRNVSEVCIESGRLNVEGVRGIVEFESRRFGECERLTGDLDSFDTRRAGGRGGGRPWIRRGSIEGEREKSEPMTRRLGRRFPRGSIGRPRLCSLCLSILYLFSPLLLSSPLFLFPFSRSRLSSLLFRSILISSLFAPQRPLFSFVRSL